MAVRPLPERGALLAASAAWGVHPVAAALRLARDASFHEAPSMLEPLGIPGIDGAVERLLRAIESKERVLVFGDYDADGVTSAAILWWGLQGLGAEPEVVLPHRSEGYGLPMARVAEFAARCDLLVTVDRGISSVAEISALRAAGVDVLVTDHHAISGPLPDALMVHPQTGGQPFASEPTGAAIAYHLLWALHLRLGLPQPVHLAPLAAIGIVADVARMDGPNRALVRVGLDAMSDSAIPGVPALLSVAGLVGRPTAWEVGYHLGPRLNAPGRLGDPRPAFELLIAADEFTARRLAAELEEVNATRKRLSEELCRSALARIGASGDAVVLQDDAWLPGLLGAAANRVLQITGLPTLLVSQGRGSLRAPAGFGAHSLLGTLQQHLVRFGGHDAAAGFSLKPGRFAPFAAAFLELARKRPRAPQTLLVDFALPADDLTDELHDELEREVGPFGASYEPARVAVWDSSFTADRVGLQKTSWQFAAERSDGSRLRGVWHAGGAVAEGIGAAAAVGRMVRSSFRGVRSLEIQAERLLPLAAPRLRNRSLKLCRADEDTATVHWTPGADDPLEPVTEALRADGACGVFVDPRWLLDPAAAFADYPNLITL